jgi:hypothetical protein
VLDQKRTRFLILIPGIDEKTEEWGKVVKAAKFSDFKIADPNGFGFPVPIGDTVFAGDLDLHVVLLWKDEKLQRQIKFLPRETDEEKLVRLKDTLLMLDKRLSHIDGLNDSPENRIVVCGHFHTTIKELRTVHEALKNRDSSKTLTDSDKKIIDSYEDPIKGKGNSIFARYTLYGEEKDKATAIVEQIKQSNQEKIILAFFDELFRFLWGKCKLEDITKLATKLFIFCHSKGNCIAPGEILKSLRIVENILSGYSNSINFFLGELFGLTEKKLLELLSKPEEMKRVFEIIDSLILELSQGI